MKRMTWRTFERKLRDGELEVNAWGRDDNWVDVRLYGRNGSISREVFELTGKPSAEWEAK